MSASRAGDSVIPDPLAASVVAALAARHESVACAESLTGGLVCAALVDVPGASAVVRGGVVAYATDLKASLLGVDPEVLRQQGAVDPEVALQLAAGAAERLGAQWGLGTTGVAGPGPSDGVAQGTVFVAVSGPGQAQAVVELQLVGSRRQIRQDSTHAVLRLLEQLLMSDDSIIA